MVDALILQHEADRLGIPAGTDMGRLWLKQATRGQMTATLFEAVLARFNNRVSGDQILADIANQVRLANVRRLLGEPIVTPYDVFRAYRDQNERVSAKLVEIPADKFLPKVPEPSPQEVQAYYDQYKDVLPDPSRATPGFKIPRQIQVEILSIDGNALARDMKDQLSETELRSAYENHKLEYQVNSELPQDLFAGQPELTPAVLRSFEEVRSTLAYSLAEEKAQAKIVDKFEAIKKDVLFPFADQYHSALTDIEEAKSQGSSSKVRLPAPSDLKELARREHLGYELSPMLSREEAERFGQISGAEIGLARLSGGRRFADEFFDPKASLFEPEELTDLLGTRYLARKLEDQPPRVPPLEEVRSQVSLAWKMERARPLAQKAAEQVAEAVKKKGGTIKESTLDGYRVVTIPLLARKQTNLLAGRFESARARRRTDPRSRPSRRNVSRCLLRSPERLARGRTQSARDGLLRLDPRSSRAGHLRGPVRSQRRRAPIQARRSRSGRTRAHRALDGMASPTSRTRSRLDPTRRGQGAIGGLEGLRLLRPSHFPGSEAGAHPRDLRP